MRMPNRQIETTAVMTRRWRSHGRNLSGRPMWRLAVHVAVHHDAQLVCDSLSVARCAGAATSHGQTCLYH